MADTSEMYLLFETLLLLFWLHSCLIWTKLTRTDTVFSRATSDVFFCAGFWIFRYTGKIHKNYIENQRSRSFDDAKGGHRAARGHPEGCMARPSPWPRHTPSWVGPTPLGALPSPYFYPPQGNSRTEVAFPIYAAEPPPPSSLLREG